MYKAHTVVTIVKSCYKLTMGNYSWYLSGVFFTTMPPTTTLNVKLHIELLKQSTVSSLHIPLCVFVWTQSFRFGPDIAYVAACTLHVLKDVWRQTLVGSTHPGLTHSTVSS